MYCTTCGKLLADGARFCMACGSPVQASDAAASHRVDTWQQTANPQAHALGSAAALQPAPLIISNAPNKDSISKCPSCGSSDIQPSPATGLLHCNYCQSEWQEAPDALDFAIHTLQGVIIGAGASDIPSGAEDLVTLQCSACGAEVVINTNDTLQARCHWCRNTLSLNNQVPNGSAPDAILPFRLSKEQARQRIEAFVRERRFFAHPRFKAEFTTENIMGVYLPYLAVDVNCHVRMSGKGEDTVAIPVSDNGTYFGYDVYDIVRDFDLQVDDLTVEASSERLNQNTAVNSNNVINSIQPFPTKETLRFNANYLKGFTSEKRDINRDAIAGLVYVQIRDIARRQASRTTTRYDRGVRWDDIQIDVRGQLWKSVYLPVWLYSYMQDKVGGKKYLHYVAVNGVTGETMGSVPMVMPKWVPLLIALELLGLVFAIVRSLVLTYILGIV